MKSLIYSIYDLLYDIKILNVYLIYIT